jgi:hypothetical protein
MRDNVIARLKSQMATAQVVLFTGAGFSRGARDRSNRQLLGVRELREELWKIPYEGQPFDPDATLGELYAVAQRRNRPALVTLLEQRFSVSPDTLPDYYRTFFAMPWFRVYTLNVDDLESAAARRFTLARVPVSISATRSGRDNQATRTPGRTLDVVHLNGLLGDPPELLTFSETQYAERVANAEPWYARCAAELRSRPVVFVGTELREETLWQHMELRRRQFPYGTATLPPGSILVTPSLTSARVDMLQALNIEWYQGTAESFAADILGRLADEARRGFVVLEAYDEARGRVGIPLVADLAAERPTLATEYLLGEEPHWSDFINGRVAGRSLDAAILRAAHGVLDGTTPATALVVTGTAGTGKSTALMRLALELSNSGIPALWVDKTSTAAPQQLRRRLADFNGKVVLAIDDADLLGSQLSNLVRDLVPMYSQLLIVFAARAGRVDDLVAPVVRGGQVRISEHVVPNLTDPDIDGLIEVLDRNNRLGILKGASPDARRRAFTQRAGRQLLVAMIEATSGEKFEEKAQSELDQLEGIQKFVYALVSVATSQRHYLTKDEVLLAAAGQRGDVIDALNQLVARHLLTARPPYYEYRTRHRVVADIVLEHLQVNAQLKEVLSGLAFAAASKLDMDADRRSRSWRLLIRFINHSFLLRLIGLNDARDIYNELENQLGNDYHFWLQRGSLEVEAGDVRLAEHFLNQARSLNTDDHRIDTEYGYMLMRKAIETPTDPRAADWVNAATQLLEGVISSRGGADSHPFHILGSQGLAWSRRSAPAPNEKRRLLAYYLNTVSEGLRRHPFQRDLAQLETDLKREILMTVTTG